jgi:hypothetical protein
MIYNNVERPSPWVRGTRNERLLPPIGSNVLPLAQVFPTEIINSNVIIVGSFVPPTDASVLPQAGHLCLLILAVCNRSIPYPLIRLAKF